MSDLAEVMRMRDALERELADHKRKGFALQYQLEGMNKVITMLGGEGAKPHVKDHGSANGTGNGAAKGKKLKRGELKGVLLAEIKQSGPLKVGELFTKLRDNGHLIKDTSIRAFCYSQKKAGILVSDAAGQFSMAP